MGLACLPCSRRMTCSTQAGTVRRFLHASRSAASSRSPPLLQQETANYVWPEIFQATFMRQNAMPPRTNNSSAANEKAYTASAAHLFDWRDPSARALLKQVPVEEIPPAEDLHTAESLQQHLD